jgi:hypothetical protein
MTYVMPRRLVLFAMALLAPLSGPALGEGILIRSAADLSRLTAPQLDALYARSSAAPMPDGRVRGLPLIAPGSTLGPVRSRTGRLVWQGKTFERNSATAVNRFFGLPVIRGKLSDGPSWRDGRQSLILDYSGTSYVYGRYRDEIRQVAPGVYLGLMFDRSGPSPTFVRYFALDVR